MIKKRYLNRLKRLAKWMEWANAPDPKRPRRARENAVYQWYEVGSYRWLTIRNYITALKEAIGELEMSESPSCAAIHKRLARFTAKRPPIPPGDGLCTRQTSVYTVATGKITASRCVRKENHEPPHRFRNPSGIVSEVKSKKRD